MKYFSQAYLSRERWISFWYQILEVKLSKPRTLLEVGPGPLVAAETLRKMGVAVTTMDIDSAVAADVRASITNLPFRRQSFDAVLAAEILEHLPFSMFRRNLVELSRVAKQVMIVTLPHFHQFAPAFSIKVFPFVPRLFKVFPISWPVKHRYDGQHYWEIGKSGYSLERVKAIMDRVEGFKLKKDYLVEENPYHHVFVLERKYKAKHAIWN